MKAGTIRQIHSILSAAFDAAQRRELIDHAYLFSNDPLHAVPWNPDWISHMVTDLAKAAGVRATATGTAASRSWSGNRR